jgi:hypothetical protein
MRPTYTIKRSFLETQSAPAWFAILGLTILTAVGTIVGAGSVIRILFPVLSFGVGVFLYFQYAASYIGFLWWIWFITPFIRRVIDYQNGWDPSGLILISPYLVTIITFITLVRHFPKELRQEGLPIVLALIGVFYGFCVGLINNPASSVVRSLLDWVAPLLLGFHIYVNWRNYPDFRKTLQQTFLWGVLVMGTYGIYQYIVAPEWDQFWLLEANFLTGGVPEPFGLRIWSTMHSPGPFAVVMETGLILLFTLQNPLTLPAAAVGYLSFLLCLVRSSWGGWLIALLLFFASLKEKLQMRLIVTIAILAICVVPLVTMDQFSDPISNRLETISRLDRDRSFNDRSKNYNRNIEIALSEVQGRGLGSTWFYDEETGKFIKLVLDSGILDIFFTLGWFGAIPYLGGLLLILGNFLKYSEARFDAFLSASRALSISFCGKLIFGSSMIGVSGLILWGFIGVAMAGHKYYQRHVPEQLLTERRFERSSLTPEPPL